MTDREEKLFDAYVSQVEAIDRLIIAERDDRLTTLRARVGEPPANHGPKTYMRSEPKQTALTGRESSATSKVFVVPLSHKEVPLRAAEHPGFHRTSDILERQGQAELRTFSRLALHGHVTVMGAQNLAGDGKPHACSDGLPLGAWATVESLENLR